MGNYKKHVILMCIIGVILLLVGIAYAFFNYTRTGNMNNITVGNVNFESNQNNTINLTNVFPTDKEHLDSTNSSTVTINISGDTNYNKGIEYKVSIVEVDNTVNDKEIPISFNVTASNLGTKSNTYYQERGSTSNVYNLVETGLAENDKNILIGYIKPDENGINGSINVTAYIDRDNIGISDTVSKIENNNLVYGETPGDWIDGRTILTTTEWNSLSIEGISFKIKVEAIEGTWIREEQLYVMKNLYLASDSTWTNTRANISSVEFHKDGVAPENPIATIDATDITSAGPVTIYTVDDGLGNNTYKVVIVADGVIYAPENSQGLFRNMTKLVTFDSTNFKVDYVTTMESFFTNDAQLEDISTLSTWDTSNVESFRSLFYGCSSLSNISSLSKWDTSKVSNMRTMFYNCSGLSNADGLLGWNASRVTTMQAMFYNCSNLENVDGLLNWNIKNVSIIDYMFFNCISLSNVNGLSNWNVGNVVTMQAMFYNCDSLGNINGLSNWNTSNVTIMKSMFEGCNNLIDISGINRWNVGNVNNMSYMFNECSSLETLNLNGWNTSKVTDMQGMFNGCSKLANLDLGSFDMSKVTTNLAMFQTTGFKTLVMPNNYTRIDDFMFNHNSSYTGDSFTVPKSVTTIGNSHIFYNFGKDSTFNRFIVESGSTSFKTIDDVLYSYDGTRLISIPRGKTFNNRTYEIPEGITFMNELSFSRNQNIDTLVLPNSYVIERYIDENNNSYGFINSGNSLSLAVYAYTSIKWYEVKNDNPNYISDNGCIYSKDGTELIAVPYHYSGVLNIKAGTTTIGQEAFWTDADAIYAIADITGINIPASVTTIDAEQLTLLNKLMRRSTNPVTITIDSGNTSYRISNNQIVAI